MATDQSPPMSAPPSPDDFQQLIAEVLREIYATVIDSDTDAAIIEKAISEQMPLNQISLTLQVSVVQVVAVVRRFNREVRVRLDRKLRETAWSIGPVATNADDDDDPDDDGGGDGGGGSAPRSERESSIDASRSRVEASLTKSLRGVSSLFRPRPTSHNDRPTSAWARRDLRAQIPSCNQNYFYYPMGFMLSINRPCCTVPCKGESMAHQHDQDNLPAPIQCSAREPSGPQEPARPCFDTSDASDDEEAIPHFKPREDTARQLVALIAIDEILNRLPAFVEAQECTGDWAPRARRTTLKN